MAVRRAIKSILMPNLDLINCSFFIVDWNLRSLDFVAIRDTKMNQLGESVRRYASGIDCVIVTTIIMSWHI